MDYKNTLLIQKTDFEMKANLPVKEPIIQKEWLDNNVYQKVLQNNKSQKHWILHDGPPYANGNIHVGHALNKIIKDFIIRSKNMSGFNSEFIPGWDTHGLPIEHALMAKNKEQQKLSIVEKRNNCHQFAQQFIEIQKKQFQQLGLLTNFQKYYATFDRNYEIKQIELLVQYINRKLVYRDLKPVYWSWSSQSALADAEVEYQDIKSPSIYVAFNVVSGKEVLEKNDKLVIWTTTPWTIPSNLAIAVNPKFTYARVKYLNDFYVISQDHLKAVSEILHWENYEVIKTIRGNELELIEYQHPLYNKTLPIILANYVAQEDGTGLVHNAPGFGEEDYLACKKYHIFPFSPIDKLGRFTKEINDQDLINVFYDDANKIVCDKLTTNKSLLSMAYVTHSVAHDWRTKKPVIYRATKQWFVDIQQIQKEILKALKDVKFNNPQNRTHIENMIKNRIEWCISRQRAWGVPIPIIYDEKDEPIFDFDLLNNIISILSQESTNAWFEKPVKYFLTNKYKEKPESAKYRKETDIMDVWFDSGTSFNVLIENNLTYPADLYFEGSDQYRGWFNSSLINGVVAFTKAPYKQLLSHGMVLDGSGQKMSKSLGNVIDPLTVCKKYGADVLRLWVASSNYENDVRVSESILNQCAELYRRLRNSLFKFCLANTVDYEEDINLNFSEVDCFILSQLKTNIIKIKTYYETYSYIDIIKTINNHVIDLSSWYFDIIKDSLYCDERDDPKRRAIQSVLSYILKSYLTLLTPIIPHTCEEAYRFLKAISKKSSICMETFPDENKIVFKEVNQDKWNYFYKIKDAVYSVLETLRSKKEINKNNQALVELSFDNKFNFIEEELTKCLNVARVKFANCNAISIEVKASDAKLIKCERCWNYYETSQMHDEHICSRCHRVITNT